jgi:hypothetical protein
MKMTPTADNLQVMSVGSAHINKVWAWLGNKTEEERDQIIYDALDKVCFRIITINY